MKSLILILLVLTTIICRRHRHNSRHRHQLKQKKNRKYKKNRVKNITDNLLHVHVFPHSHMDLAWLDPFEVNY